MNRAVVRWSDHRWVVETDGVLEYEGGDQIEAELVAVESLARRGGELLIRDARGRQLKRIVIEAAG
jgi:hypothetical protein